VYSWLSYFHLFRPFKNLIFIYSAWMDKAEILVGDRCRNPNLH
jgi:hypothetical protein